jgi:lysophospholipase L1-like esterase
MAGQRISLADMRRIALVAVMTLTCACPAAAAPSLLHVGDSLAAGSDPPLRRLLPGWSVTTDALKSRPTSAGVAIIDRQPALPGSLVVELGTNDSPDQSARFAGYVRHVLALAGPSRCVVWVNVHRPPYNGVSYAGFNRALDQIAASSSNLAVVDWNGMVDSGAADVAGDGVHSTPAGYEARAAAIAQALQGCSAQQRSSGSHTIPAGKRRHRSAAPKPRAKPKPEPAAKPKPIKVYTPTTTTPAAKPAAARASKGSGSSAAFLAGALVVLLLGGAGYALVRRRRS